MVHERERRVRRATTGRTSARLGLVVAVALLAGPVPAQDYDAEPPTACLGVNVITLEDVIFGNAGGSWEYESLKNGLPVVNVVRGSPASMIGLRVGDFIVSLNGRPVYLPGELVSRVRAHEIGERFELEIYRRGEFLTARGILGELAGNLCHPAQAPKR